MVKEQCAHVNGLPCQRNVLNSNHAALTSTCDSAQELRLVRIGDAKADRMKPGKERAHVFKD